MFVGFNLFVVNLQDAMRVGFFFAQNLVFLSNARQFCEPRTTPYQMVGYIPWIAHEIPWNGSLVVGLIPHHTESSGCIPIPKLSEGLMANDQVLHLTSSNYNMMHRLPPSNPQSLAMFLGSISDYWTFLYAHSAIAPPKKMQKQKIRVAAVKPLQPWAQQQSSCVMDLIFEVI